MKQAEASHRKLLGIDTGGTFTDFVYLDDSDPVNGPALRVHKVLSTPESPEQAILTGIQDMGLAGAVRAGEIRIVHGTTVATNATLTGSGVRTAYITNRGLKDVLTIGRQTRGELYQLKVSKPTLDPDPALSFEINARISATGEVIAPLEAADLQTLKSQVLAARPEAIAINMLFSFIDDTHERTIEALFSDKFFTSRSSSVLPEYREYERGVATWINAWIGPLMARYLTSLKAALSSCPLAIMQSSGLTIAADQAANKAVNLLLSGPVGGLSAAILMGRVTGRQGLMTFDMGGTSTDVSLLQGGEHPGIRLTNESKIAGLPIAIPMADIHTIGAGGGSIAYIDEGGLLQAGPASAGADPGPACYCRGGDKPTVTDANLVLGRLHADAFLGGRMPLDPGASVAALTPLAAALDISVTEVAEGIISIANEHMAQALRAISIEKGFDPREYTLVCFGGAGGLHLCHLAESLEMTGAMVPVHGGVLSALGMLATRPGRQVTRSYFHQAHADGKVHTSVAEADNLDDMFEAMEQTARAELAAEGVFDMVTRRSLDLRYQGQTFTLNVPCNDVRRQTIEAFRQAHLERYGHQLDREVELVNLKVHAEAAGQDIALPAWNKKGVAKGEINSSRGNAPIAREQLAVGEVISGPRSITEAHATTYIAEGWCARLDQFGNLALSR